MEKKKSFKWLIADLIFMYIITGLGLVLMAVLLDKFQQGETFVNVGIIIIYILSGFFGGLIAGKKMKTKKFLWGLLLGTVYFVILLAVSIVVNSGLPQDLVHTITTFVICIAAGMLGGMLG